LLTFWFLSATCFSVPDEPLSNRIPLTDPDEHPLTPLLPSTPMSLRVTFAARMITWVKLLTNVPPGIVMTAAPVLPEVLVTPFSVSGVVIVTCSG
jgi:hypothetical protein